MRLRYPFRVAVVAVALLVILLAAKSYVLSGPAPESRSHIVPVQWRGHDSRPVWPGLFVASFLVSRRSDGEESSGGDESASAKSSGVSCLSEAQARALVQSLDRAAIVAITDRKGRILYANNNFSRISGYSIDELVGADHRLLNSGRHPKSFWKEMYREVSAGRVWRAEVCNRAKSGEEYWVDTTISAVRDEAGAIKQFVALRVDITSRKVAEQALRATKDELEEALGAAAALNAELRENYEKLFEAKAEAEAAARAKSDFLANMSHEIRTPMTAIVGFAELLTDDDEQQLPSKQRRLYLQAIWQQSEHLLNLINDILDMSKIESGKLTTERIDVNPRLLVQEISQLLARKAEAKGIDLRCVIGDGVPESIQSDPTRLRQILINLVGNALKFTERGCVEVRVETTDLEAGSGIEILVRDTGIGMDKDTVARLFRAFEQADASTTRRYGGTGLGLRISKHLAKALGGDIRVQSECGVGSVFTVILPVSGASGLSAQEGVVPAQDKQPPPSGRDAQGRSSLPLSGVQILLAEDGDDNALLFTHHLTRAGADVVRCVNGLEAVRLICGQPGEASAECKPDVVIMDMQMPVMDGYTAASILRDRGCTLPIIAATAHAMREDRHKCIEAGCTDYIAKPFERSRLISVVRQAIGCSYSAAA
ncbi:MAG: ATP-binding protein [Phycisphaerales bacterium JB065]